MSNFFEDIFSITRTKKFWVAVAGAVVAYALATFGQSNELTLFTGLLMALGVYGVSNES